MTVAERMRTQQIPRYVGLVVAFLVLRFLGWLGVVIALVAIVIAIDSLNYGAS